MLLFEMPKAKSFCIAVPSWPHTDGKVPAHHDMMRCCSPGPLVYARNCRLHL